MRRAAAAIPGVSASELAVGTDVSATVLGGGISYAPTAKAGGKVPLDAFWLYESVVASSGGIVPKVGVDPDGTPVAGAAVGRRQRRVRAPVRQRTTRPSISSA